MKRTFAISLFFLVCVNVCAQQKNIIVGNIGVENVNISVAGTPYGTASDVKGDYELLLFGKDKTIELIYTCIGYHDTSVFLTPKILENDTVRISFNMKRMNYMLDEALVSSEKTVRYREPKYVLMDFEIVDDKVMMLQRKDGSKTDSRILVTDILFNAVDTIPIARNHKPESLHADCFGQCQIVCQDSVYQIVGCEKGYRVEFPSERKHYFEVMQNSLFFTEKYLYYKQANTDIYSDLFFRVNLEDKKSECIFRNVDEKSRKEYFDEMNYYSKHPLGHGPTLEEWSVFLQNAWIHPKPAFLFAQGDTLVFFNHSNQTIERYDESLKLLGKCDISYPTKKEFWRYKIFHDTAFDRYYTIFGTTLNEIDIYKGTTTPKVEVNQWTNNKIVIYKGMLFTLKRKIDSGGTWVSYIDRVKID